MNSRIRRGETPFSRAGVNMGKWMSIRWQISAASLVLVSIPVVLRADELNVPSQFPNIQAAITAAQPGDVVKVAPNPYNEAIDFGGKAITLVSTAGSATTIIDGTNLKKAVVSFKTAETSTTVLDGFTITNGVQVGATSLGGGIFIDKSSPTIKNCLITKNSAGKGAGVYIQGDGAGAVIDSCQITANTGLAAAAGA